MFKGLRKFGSGVEGRVVACLVQTKLHTYSQIDRDIKAANKDKIPQICNVIRMIKPTMLWRWAIVYSIEKGWDFGEGRLDLFNSW